MTIKLTADRHGIAVLVDPERKLATGFFGVPANSDTAAEILADALRDPENEFDSYALMDLDWLEKAAGPLVDVTPDTLPEDAA